MGAILHGGVLGLGSLFGVLVLVSRGRSLGLLDALTVLAVLMASAGHLVLAGRILADKAHWPLPHGEAANVLRFIGWFSVGSAIVGAAQTLSVSFGARGVQGVVVNRTMEFLLRTILFTLPGLTLLFAESVAFRTRRVTRRFPSSSSRTTTASSLPTRAPFFVEVSGRYERRRITTRWTGKRQPETPAIEAAVARTWEAQAAIAAAEDRLLFDGHLVRLVRLSATQETLELELGPTRYRQFVGTNLYNTAMVLGEGRACLADPLGVSATLITSDGFLALGRRSRRVAYHGGFLHPFGGMLEPADRRPDRGGNEHDVFGCVLRELHEELGVQADQVSEIVVTGLIRDRTILQPELLFDVSLTIARSVLSDRFDPAAGDGEHSDIEFICDDPETIVPFLRDVPRLTPVAQGAMLLHGRHMYGATWYEQACYLVYGELPQTVDATPVIES